MTLIQLLAIIRVTANREQTEALLRLLNLATKREVEKYCRKLMVSSEAFTDIILAGRINGMKPYLYNCHFVEYTPEHLHPTPDDLNALGTSGVGPLNKRAKKTMNKVTQIFKDRRQFSAHLFYMPSHKQWHLFYFDQRDLTNDRNHWLHGPHIHYSRESYTNKPLQEIWDNVTAVKPKLPKTIHIRYDYHHNRRA
ncbi:MAG: hypothetical protein ACI9BW_003874 [Gammaproteobacteria bacterium]